MGRILVVTLLLAVACGRDEPGSAVQDDATASSTAASQAGSESGGGLIVGTLFLEGNPPPSPTIDMASDPGCLAMYDGGSPTDFRIVSRDGKLGQGLIYVKSGLPAGYAYEVPDRNPVFSAHECRFQPSIFGVRVGQELSFQNGDSVEHHVVVRSRHGNDLQVALAPHEISDKHRFAFPEVMVELACEDHPWMHAWIAALDHPFFAWTAEDGQYTIEGLPPGTYELEAWHSELGRQTMRVEVGANETVTANFAFSVDAS